jgi:hypothetical protein
MFKVKDENIETSKALKAELERTTDGKQCGLLKEKLEYCTGPVCRAFIQECLTDINSLPELLRGNLVSKKIETYDVEVDNRAKLDRYGYEMIVIDGKKKQFNPALSDPVYEDIPKMVIERSRTVYTVNTNREAIMEIEKLLQGFLARVRGEFKHESLDFILEQKRLTELELSKIDRTQLTRSTMSEAEFQEATYIKRPDDRYRNVAPDDALFSKFDALKAAL